ncbi:MAG TPA: Xaa-Pro peptidase family protein [Vicinamibacterales bacterium]
MRGMTWLVAIGLVVVLSGPAVAQEAGFSAADFTARRDKLISQIGDAVAVVPPSNADVWYLSGIEGREVGLILVPPGAARRAPNPEAWKTTAYLPARSPRAGVWNDTLTSVGDDIKAQTGIDNTAPVSRLLADVAKLALIADTIYIPYRSAPAGDGELAADLKFVESVRRMLPEVRIKNLAPLITDMRWAKSAAEITVMRRAEAITADAFIDAAKRAAPGMFEYEIEAGINHIFRARGSSRPAFLIIGSGPNSCILHHMSNDRQMRQDELLLIDIGTVYKHTETDLTRTIPVSGTFTPEQRKIYDIVLEANKKAIAAVKPGMTLADVHRVAYDVIDKAGYGKYLIHGTNHTLNGGSERLPHGSGLVPDRTTRPGFSNDKPIVPGTMFTIEPGIYIPEKNLGIRIEDDVLVTDTGCEVLTAGAPKEIAEIEKLVRSGKPGVTRH